MTTNLWLMGLVALPLCLAGAAFLPRSPRAVLRLCLVGTLALALLAALGVRHVFVEGACTAARGWLRLDALSAFHVVVMNAVFVLSAIDALLYFGDESGHAFTLREARRFGGLWFGTYGAMALVLSSNNLGTMWMGVEATTLLTAFLICIPVTPASLEAMWKYLVMCSVGVALAFGGILMTVASANGAGLGGVETLQWTSLMAVAPALNTMLVKAGFIFLVVGFGVKAGLAPMHNWLPDAHGQAPAPVSALFSGFLLNAALYAILRVLPLAEAASGGVGWARGILIGFGIVSIFIAAVFILAQHDIKRLLAYHSVEHIGIITFGAGLGGLGAFACLFHTLNHSLCKALSFFCAGRLGQIYGTHDMRRMTGLLRASPVWGLGLTASLLALIGLAPFSLFLSELLILKAALDGGVYLAMILFLLGLAVVFAGASRHAISMAWEDMPPGVTLVRTGPIERLIVLLPLAVLLVTGLWIPGPLRTMLEQAARVMGGGL